MIVTLKKIEARCDEMSPATAPAPRRGQTYRGGGLARLLAFASALWLAVRPG